MVSQPTTYAFTDDMQTNDKYMLVCVGTGFSPAALVSLTAPKRCARLYTVSEALCLDSTH